MPRGGKRIGAGRKKGFAALEAEKARKLLAQKLQTEFSPIVDKAIEQAKNGDSTAREWVTRRAYGNVPEQVELGNMDDEPFQITDEQYKQLIKSAGKRIDSDKSGK